MDTTTPARDGRELRLTMTRLTAHDAIEYAAAHGLTLRKYADPAEDAREGLTVDEAREIAAEDPSLIYVDIDGGSDAEWMVEDEHGTASAQGLTRNAAVSRAQQLATRTGRTWYATHPVAATVAVEAE